MSDSSSEYTGTDDSSSSSDEEPQLLAKPVFIKRNKSQPKSVASAEAAETTGATDHKNVVGEDQTGSKVLHNLQVIDKANQESQVVESFDGIDDTDGLDPEQEYEAWRIREYNRYMRDRQQIIELEEMQSDMIRRSQMTEEELTKEYKDRQAQASKNGDEMTAYKSRAQEYKEKQIDHSRPTRFKPT